MRKTELDQGISLLHSLGGSTVLGGSLRSLIASSFSDICLRRFYETDSWLVGEISRCGKKFVFVRTKVDVDVLNDRRAHPRTHR